MPARIIIPAKDHLYGGNDIEFKIYSLDEVLEALPVYIDSHETILCLVNRGQVARALAQVINARGFKARALVADLNPYERKRLFDDFRNRDFDVMIVSDPMIVSWHAPEHTTALFHLEIPMYGYDFVAKMWQREARLEMRI